MALDSLINIPSSRVDAIAMKKSNLLNRSLSNKPKEKMKL
jgi:hypothetical protein